MKKVPLHHPQLPRRAAIQAGAVSILGLGMNHLAALQALSGESASRPARAKSVIFIFLSGGLSQHDSFDMKPDAPPEVRGEFQSIPTKTPGFRICEHLPHLAKCSNLWSVCRSLTHPFNEHSQGHHAMLTGRSDMPDGFDPGKPKESDWPSIASLAGSQLSNKGNNLPPAVILPEKLIHRSGRVIPGQFGGKMGHFYDPFFIEASRFNAKNYGAYPEYLFHHERGREDAAHLSFEAPNLTLPERLANGRLTGRLDLLAHLDAEQAGFERMAETADLDRHRQRAAALLFDPKTRRAFDVHAAPAKDQDRYGRNSFGWSLLMARQLVESGVRLVQVNLGNNEAWDTHQSAFPNLKNFLLPPMDRGVAALLSDLQEKGMLDDTLVVMAGEFGRTPKISAISGARLPGRDHWGAAQTVFLAGGGLQGGRVIGSTDKLGAFPASEPQTPENLAATIYESLGLPRDAKWLDSGERPHMLYNGRPIPGLV